MLLDKFEIILLLVDTISIEDTVMLTDDERPILNSVLNRADCPVLEILGMLLVETSVSVLIPALGVLLLLVEIDLGDD